MNVTLDDGLNCDCERAYLSNYAEHLLMCLGSRV
jgi:hypothetical protein